MKYVLYHDSVTKKHHTIVFDRHQNHQRTYQTLYGELENCEPIAAGFVSYHEEKFIPSSRSESMNLGTTEESKRIFLELIKPGFGSIGWMVHSHLGVILCDLDLIDKVHSPLENNPFIALGKMVFEFKEDCIVPCAIRILHAGSQVNPYALVEEEFKKRVASLFTDH